MILIKPGITLICKGGGCLSHIKSEIYVGGSKSSETTRISL